MGLVYTRVDSRSRHMFDGDLIAAGFYVPDTQLLNG